jgi:hypothetical protein
LVVVGGIGRRPSAASEAGLILPAPPPTAEEIKSNRALLYGFVILGVILIIIPVVVTLISRFVDPDLPRAAGAGDVPRFTVERIDNGFRITNRTAIIWPVCWMDREGRRKFLPSLKPRATITISDADFEPATTAKREPAVYCGAGDAEVLAWGSP